MLYIFQHSDLHHLSQLPYWHALSSTVSQKCIKISTDLEEGRKWQEQGWCLVPWPSSVPLPHCFLHKLHPKVPLLTPPLAKLHWDLLWLYDQVFWSLGSTQHGTSHIFGWVLDIWCCDWPLPFHMAGPGCKKNSSCRTYTYWLFTTLIEYSDRCFEYLINRVDEKSIYLSW